MIADEEVEEVPGYRGRWHEAAGDGKFARAQNGLGQQIGLDIPCYLQFFVKAEQPFFIALGARKGHVAEAAKQNAEANKLHEPAAREPAEPVQVGVKNEQQKNDQTVTKNSDVTAWCTAGKESHAYPDRK